MPEGKHNKPKQPLQFPALSVSDQEVPSLHAPGTAPAPLEMTKREDLRSLRARKIALSNSFHGVIVSFFHSSDENSLDFIHYLKTLHLIPEDMDQEARSLQFASELTQDIIARTLRDLLRNPVDGLKVSIDSSATGRMDEKIVKIRGTQDEELKLDFTTVVNSKNRPQKALGVIIGE